MPIRIPTGLVPCPFMAFSFDMPWQSRSVMLTFVAEKKICGPAILLDDVVGADLTHVKMARGQGQFPTPIWDPAQILAGKRPVTTSAVENHRTVFCLAKNARFFLERSPPWGHTISGTVRQTSARATVRHC